MKIAINALGVDGGGGQTYLENLLPELDQISDRTLEYYILLRTNHSVDLPPLSSRFKTVPFTIPPPYLIGRFLVEQAHFPLWLKHNKIDLLYSPADWTTLLSPCPTVLAMRNPNLYVSQNLGWSLRYKAKFAVLSRMAALSTKKARQIIFVSEASRKLVTQKIKIPEKKINVIHHGVSHFFFEKMSMQSELLKLFHDKMPYILSISSIYRYKNFIRLIEAFSKIQSKLNNRFHLIVIGSSFDNDYFKSMLKTIERLNLKNQVHYLGGFKLRDLPAIYQKASLFAFPSFLETFGHTLVEAMASEIPIAAGDIEPTREITGGAACYFDPFNINEIANALVECLTNVPLRNDLIAKGKDQVKKFSWEKCASETLKTFVNAAAKQP